VTGLIAGSLLLLTGAAASVVYGWISENQAFVWLSVASSAGTAVLLALAYSKSKAEVAAALERRRSRRPPPRSARPARARAAPPPAGPPAAAARRRSRSQERTGAGARRRRGSGDRQVVAVPGVRKYHRPDCRYARVTGAETMSRSAARRRSFEACGICRP
jgi:hypothetical protein